MPTDFPLDYIVSINYYFLFLNHCLHHPQLRRQEIQECITRQSCEKYISFCNGLNSSDPRLFRATLCATKRWDQTTQKQPVLFCWVNLDRPTVCVEARMHSVCIVSVTASVKNSSNYRFSEKTRWELQRLDWYS